MSSNIRITYIWHILCNNQDKIYCLYKVYRMINKSIKKGNLPKTMFDTSKITRDSVHSTLRRSSDRTLVSGQ